MKKHLIFGIIIISSIILLNNYSINAQGNNKVKTFNESLQYEANNDYQKALDVLVKNSFGNNSYLMNMRLGWLYYKVEDYENSRKFYTAAISQQNNSIEARLGLTLPLGALNEWDDVTNLYLAILKIDVKNYYANLRLGQIYLNKGDYSNAKKYLERVFTLYPAEYEVNLSLGWTYLYLGEKQKAKQLLTSALMMNENDESATEGLKKLED